MAQRIGVAGYGARGRWLAQEAARAGADITAICDPSERSRSQARLDWPDARVVSHLDELLGAPSGPAFDTPSGPPLAALIVAAPDDRHARLAAAALRRGVPVFCEKPMATTLADCDALLAAAYRTGTRLYLGHNMRHMPVVQVMKRLVEAGRIGEVQAVWCRHFVGHGGDYYFKDWHADRSHSGGLLLQKGAHDIDVIHYLAGAYTRRASAVGALQVYGRIADRRDRRDQRMDEWFSLDNWPPLSLTGLNPVVDVEDISQVNLVLGDGRLASYEQCHFTPDYWRNYTVIGAEGRIENRGDGAGAVVGLWNRRTAGWSEPQETFLVPDAAGGHGGADAAMMAEFLRFAAEGGPTTTSPLAAREAVATGLAATESLRGAGGLLDVPPPDPAVAAYFEAGQP
jgi:predicted dehydrogenase